MRTPLPATVCSSRNLTLLSLLLTLSPAWLKAEESAAPPDSIPAVEEALVLADLVLRRHIDPPTRQEMLLAAARALYREAGRPLPAGLSQQISEAAGEDALREVLRAACEEFETHAPQQEAARDGATPRRGAKAAGDVVRGAILAIVSGGPAITTVDEQRVAAQFQSNRYVGTGIALSSQDGVPVMTTVFEGGPAKAAGARDGDRIERIDDRDTAGLELIEVVKLLRGAEGTPVVVALRQPGETEARVVTIVRGVVPLKTVDGYRVLKAFETREGERPGGGEATRPGAGAGAGRKIAVVHVSRIAASTVHELEQLREQFARDGVRGLVLDLRGVQESSRHHAVLLADAFLDKGMIGRVRGAERVETYTAEPEELFPGLPVALVVGRFTRGAAEWFAVALQDNGRAKVVGEPTPGMAWAHTDVPLPDGVRVLRLATATFERGDGRALARPGGAADPGGGGPDVVAHASPPAAAPARDAAARSPGEAVKDALAKLAEAAVGGGATESKGRRVRRSDQRNPSTAPWGVTPDVIVGAASNAEAWGQVAADAMIAAAVEELRGQK
jgi:carboxyl-terminal processing protease